MFDVKVSNKKCILILDFKISKILRLQNKQPATAKQNLDEILDVIGDFVRTKNVILDNIFLGCLTISHEQARCNSLDKDFHKLAMINSPDIQYGLPGPELLLGDIWKPCGKLTLYGMEGSGTGWKLAIPLGYSL